MSLSSYDPRYRYRKRFLGRMSGVVVAVCAAGIFIGFGFLLGQQYASQEAVSYRQKAEEMREQRDFLQNSLNELRAEAQTATVRLEQLQETYDRQLPEEGALSELIALVQKRLEEGAKPERLAYLLRSSQSPRNCTEPETRRFVISTPAYKGPVSQIDIAEGALVIRGSGLSAMNKEGAPEAWYDASKRVSIEFIKSDGSVEEKAGVMPFYHSVVSGEREYRFTVAEGARSFAKVDFDSCDYP